MKKAGIFFPLLFLTAGCPFSYSGYQKNRSTMHPAFSLFLIQFSVSAPVPVLQTQGSYNFLNYLFLVAWKTACS